MPAKEGACSMPVGPSLDCVIALTFPDMWLYLRTAFLDCRMLPDGCFQAAVRHGVPKEARAESRGRAARLGHGAPGDHCATRVRGPSALGRRGLGVRQGPGPGQLHRRGPAENPPGKDVTKLASGDHAQSAICFGINVKTRLLAFSFFKTTALCSLLW